MVFALDVGNLYIALGGIENGTPRFVFRLSTDRSKTGDEYAVLFNNILNIHKANIRDLEGAILSSVVPSLTVALKEAILTLTGIAPLVVGPGLRTGLNILLDNPGQMGSDIVVAAVAALDKYPLPCVAVSMSTAITLGVLDERGRYLGGAICPGIAVSLEALTRNTSQLPGISLEAPKKIIGRSTIECMQSGLLHGTAAMLDGMLERFEEELGAPPTTVFTGVSAETVLPHCRRPGILYDAHLRLRGLWLLYQKNTKR